MLKFFKWKHHVDFTVGLLGLVGALAALVDGAIGGFALIIAAAFIVTRHKV